MTIVQSGTRKGTSRYSRSNRNRRQQLQQVEGTAAATAGAAREQKEEEARSNTYCSLLNSKHGNTTVFGEVLSQRTYNVEQSKARRLVASIGENTSTSCISSNDGSNRQCCAKRLLYARTKFSLGFPLKLESVGLELPYNHPLWYTV